MTREATWRFGVAAVLVAALVVALGLLFTILDPSGIAHAAKSPTAPTPPATPTPVASPATVGGISININGSGDKPSDSIVTLIGITLLAIAPSLLIMTTSFTKIFVVLAMTRNALSLTNVPPNQVIAGLALFLSLFIMAPVISQVNTDAIQPFLNGQLDTQGAFAAAEAPLRKFMLSFTRQEDIALMTRAAGLPNPKTAADVAFSTLVPAFLISELRSAFIIGFVIFVPFLVIDLVVSAALMSLGMMMLPPVTVSLPFKILLFVLVDGWGLITTALIRSYTGGG